MPFIFLMSCLAVTIGLFLYRAGNDATEVLARNALMETMSRVGQAIDQQLQGVRETLRVVAPNPIPPLEKNGTPVLIPFPKDKAALEERLWLANALFDDPSYAYFGAVDGSFLGLKEEHVNRYIYSRRDAGAEDHVYYLPGPGAKPELIATQDYDPRTRPWYIQAMERQQETWSPVFRDSRLEIIGITLSKPVYTQEHVLLGVAGSSIDLHSLGQSLRTLPLTKSGVAFIIEMDGNLIATTVDEPIHKLAGAKLERLSASRSTSPMVREAYAHLLESLKTHKLIPGEVVVQRLQGDADRIELAYRLYQDGAGLNWIEVSAVSRSDFLGSVTGGVYQTLLFGLAAVCLTFVLGFAMLRWVLRDIRKLTLAAKSIGNGEPFPILNIDRKDEIGQLAQSFKEMEHNLRTDRLTSVLNRDSFIAQIDFRLGNGGTAAPLQFALLFIDLDKFKTINDQYGHDEGDRVLVTTAAQLQHALRKDDAVGRFGGDEFVVYLHGVVDEDIAKSIAEKIRHSINRPISGRDGALYQVDASVGVALFPQDGLDIETLLRVADERMFEQKRLHRLFPRTAPEHSDEAV